MPTRDIKESARTSETLAQLSHGAERLFWRLITVADDFGRMPAHVAVVRAACFPMMLHKVKPSDVQSWLDELTKADLVRLYSDADGKPFAFFTTWGKHQRTRAKHSKYPPPPSDGMCRQMPADVAVVTEDTEVLPKPPKKPTSVNPSPRAEEAAPWGSVEALVQLYNAQTPDNVAAVEVLSPKRRDKARRALALCPQEAFWREVFEEYGRSKFLRGLAPARVGHEGFRPDFDWLLATGKDGTENFVKVHGGRYAD